MVKVDNPLDEVSLMNVISSFIKTKLIHYITINLDVGEYGVLEEILFAKQRQKITFCQVSKKAKAKLYIFKF